jgi:DNA-binding transcriptional ArsR family regulator
MQALFGNRTAERVLTFLAVNDVAYAKQIADALAIPLSVVQKQLRRLELGGVLASRLVGRTRLYAMNPRFAVTRELTLLLKRAFALLPDKEQLPYESQRSRPRLAGKPVRLPKRKRA